MLISGSKIRIRIIALLHLVLTLLSLVMIELAIHGNIRRSEHGSLTDEFIVRVLWTIALVAFMSNIAFLMNKGRSYVLAGLVYGNFGWILLALDPISIRLIHGIHICVAVPQEGRLIDERSCLAFNPNS
jgi:hypothetical protein